jgi:hypothetical protein
MSKQPMIIDDDIKQIDLLWLFVDPDVGPALSASDSIMDITGQL